MMHTCAEFLVAQAGKQRGGCKRNRNKCKSSNGAGAASFSLENSELQRHEQLLPKKMATFFKVKSGENKPDSDP